MKPNAPRERHVDLTFSLDTVVDDEELTRAAAKQLNEPASSLGRVEILRRSLDARGGRVLVRVKASIDAPPRGPLGAPEPTQVKGTPRVVIIGMGPAGTFAAYALARRGIPSIILDRGKPVQPRRKDLKRVNQSGSVDPESNYCFGEGGAGTYSDGKLYTRATKRGPVVDVLEILARHGAPTDILIDARPHIGSNLLPKVVTAMREHLEACGVTFRFDARASKLIVKAGAVTGVVLHDGTVIDASHVVVATGHSARDVLEMLDEVGAPLESKSFALGVRVEHPQQLIDEIQYGRAAGHPALPAAAYSLVHTEDNVGVFSFCMCPGGFIVPAVTAPSEIVVNGMSPKKRNSKFANSGLVVGVSPEDAARAGFSGWRACLDLQKKIEAHAFVVGGGEFRAPAQRVSDFVARRASSSVPETSYQPGLAPTDVGVVLDVVNIGLAERLRHALPQFNQKMRGYVTDEAVLVGVESRTSSPVRVIRDKDTLESPAIAGLYPTGEGAGFAGGIVSAAIDGMAVAARIAARLGVDDVERTRPPTVA